jgi:hypothetical protein
MSPSGNEKEEFDELQKEQAGWPVRWRWEGASGHPRRMADALARAFEEQGLAVEMAVAPSQPGPLENVAEFEGVLVSRARQPRSEALREKWAAAVLGVLLTPVLVGLFLIRFALDGRRYGVSLEWRGEAYSTRARADQGGFGAERSGVVSEVRLTLRAAAFDGGQLKKGAQGLHPALDALQARLDAALPSLAPSVGQGSEAQGLGAGTAPTELAPGSGTRELDGPPDPPEIGREPTPPEIGDGR